MTTIIREWMPKEDGYVFRTVNGETFWVSSFREGLAVFNFDMGESIQSVAEKIESCFNSGSNVEMAFHTAFQNFEKLTMIQFELNTAVVTITAEKANRIRILKEYYDSIKSAAVWTNK